MIRSKLLLLDGTLINQDENLSETWRANAGSFLWVDLVDEAGEKEKAVLEELGCHPLAIKDAQRLRHPPKIESFDEHFFILYKGITKVEPGIVLDQIQISIFVGSNIIITRHHSQSFAVEHWWNNEDLSEVIKEPFLLASKLIHHSFGRYLEAVLDFEQTLSEKEESVHGFQNDDDLRELTLYKSRLRKLRRNFNYHERLALGMLNFVSNHKDERYRELIHDVQDLYERADRILSLLAMYYEICGDLIEGYLSLTSHQLNKTMQVLTIVTTVFVPLSFLAGIYGMNFDNIPELHHQYGYFILLGTMGLIASGAFIVFKLKRWI